MPIVECVFQPPPNMQVTAQQMLEVAGPILGVEIGFDPASFGAPITPTTQDPAASPQVPIILPAIQVVLALLDTGASHSCIDEDLANQLNLPIINQISIAGVSGAHMTNVYLARVYIPGLQHLKVGSFTGARLAAGNQLYRALIGRDLMKDMLLVYDGRDGRVKLAV